MYLNTLYIKLICILFFTILFAACTEIAEPDLSGIDGLSGYNDPIPPLWRKNNGRMVFYAEKSGGTSPYLFENAFTVHGGLSCPCGESYDCGCRAAGGGPAEDGEGCACQKVSVAIGGLTPNSGEETGIVLAAAARNCECSAASSCGCASPDGENCTCEKKEHTKQKRAQFTIKPEENKFKYIINLYNADTIDAVKTETGYANNIDTQNEIKLSIRYDAENRTFIFFINDARIYPPAAAAQSAFQFELNETSALYYYTAHGTAAPSRQSPYKREFYTESPQQYP